MRINQNQDVRAVLRIEDYGVSFFENQALKYFCQPIELESVRLKTYFERNEFDDAGPKSRKNPVIPFQVDTGFFKHPSAKEVGQGRTKKVVCGMGAKLRPVPVFVK